MKKEKFKYSIHIFWSEKDKGYVATIPDLPGCSVWGFTEDDVVREIYDAAKALLHRYLIISLSLNNQRVNYGRANGRIN